MGVKLSRSMPRDCSSGSRHAGTSRRLRSGRIESSVDVNISEHVRVSIEYEARGFCGPPSTRHPRKPTQQQNDNAPSRVKSKRAGRSFPLGIFVPSSRRSSKKGWHIASIALNRALGVYSSSRDTRSIASTGVRGRNTYNNDGAICKRAQRKELGTVSHTIRIQIFRTPEHGLQRITTTSRRSNRVHRRRYSQEGDTQHTLEKGWGLI